LRGIAVNKIIEIAKKNREALKDAFTTSEGICPKHGKCYGVCHSCISDEKRMRQEALRKEYWEMKDGCKKIICNSNCKHTHIENNECQKSDADFIVMRWDEIENNGKKFPLVVCDNYEPIVP
jgi:hypothetical protein